MTRATIMLAITGLVVLILPHATTGAATLTLIPAQPAVSTLTAATRTVVIATTPTCAVFAISLPPARSPDPPAIAAYVESLAPTVPTDECLPYFAFGVGGRVETGKEGDVRGRREAAGEVVVFSRGSLFFRVGWDASNASAPLSATLVANVSGTIPVGWGGGFAYDEESGVVWATGEASVVGVDTATWQVVGRVALGAPFAVVPLDGTVASHVAFVASSSLDHSRGVVSAFAAGTEPCAPATSLVLPDGAGWPFHVAALAGSRLAVFSTNGTTVVRRLAGAPWVAGGGAFVPLGDKRAMAELACDGGDGVSYVLVDGVWTAFAWPGDSVGAPDASPVPGASGVVFGSGAAHACAVVGDGGRGVFGGADRSGRGVVVVAEV